MQTRLQDYSTYPDGAPAGHTHFGSGASSVASGILSTTGLLVGQTGGATLDETALSNTQRSKVRMNLLSVSSSTDGRPSSGAVLKYTHGVGALGFTGFRSYWRYVKTAVAGNANVRIQLYGSRSGLDFWEDSFLLGQFLATNDVLAIELRYTPGIGGANGLVEYRGWREAAGAPAFRSVSVHPSYNGILGPGGMLDWANSENGNSSNTKILSTEIEGDWPTYIGGGIQSSFSLGGPIISQVNLVGSINSSLSVQGSFQGWLGETPLGEDWINRPVAGETEWIEGPIPSLGWSSND